MADSFIVNDPYVSIDGTDWVARARRVSLIPRDTMADAATYESPGLEIPTNTVWTFEAEFQMTYGASGLWDDLNTMAKTSVAFIIRPDTGTIGVTNPQADFNAYAPTPTFLDAGIGEATTFRWSTIVIGAPVFTTA